MIVDGGHIMQQQINTFEEMFSYLDEDGICFCEDMHTSYWKGWGGGGYRKRGTFVEYSKNFIDYINAWHSQTPMLKVSDFTRSAKSLHFYNSILVIEKAVDNKPVDLRTGESTVKQYRAPARRLRRLKNKLRNLFGF